ncbi:hypothetical protein ACU635_45800 [[Actinomadura] parvosata]|uniref:hypothetical protein n=1 Tax=[Actinomadura] parvosata TaxID=1955412 RepID=UPI00406D41F3
MTTAFMVDTPAPPVRGRSGATGARVWWLLAAGWLAQVALRLWLNRYHTTPVANPDETGYLLAARWLAGGAGADLSGSTFYQAGYALLLVPVFWLTSDPEVAYRLAVGVGAMAAASAYPVAYVLLRRLRLDRRAALVAAFVAGLSPALLVFSGFALADAILPVVVLAWLTALHDLVTGGPERRRGPARSPSGGSLRRRVVAWSPAGGAGRRRVLAGITAGGLAAYAMATHLRGTVIVAVCLLMAVALWRRLPRSALIATLASAVAGAVAGDALNAALRAALYPGGPRDLSALLVERLTSVDGQAWALSGAAGQLWYLVTGTWGLSGVGLAGAAALLARRSAPLAPRVLAGALLAATLGIAYASSAALPDEHRVGNFAYGRYLACVAVAWTLAGLLTLLRARRLAVLRCALAAAGLLAVTGGVTAWYAGDRLHRHAFIAFDFPEVIFLTRTSDALDLVTASLSALALLTCLTAGALIRRPVRATLAPRPATASIQRPATVPRSATASIQRPATVPRSATAALARRPAVAVVGVLALIHLAFIAHLAPSPPAPGPDWLPAPAPPGRVAVEAGVRWNVWVPLSYRVWWTGIERFHGTTPPAGVCTAVVQEDAGPPPEGWAVTGARHGWATWSRC